MASYLNEYKKQENAARNKLSERFFGYLLSQCLPKLYQRMSTLPALAFAYGLVTHWSIFQVHITQFKWASSEFAEQGPGDQTLASCIKSNIGCISLLEDAFGPEAPEQYQSFLEDHKSFKLLVSAAESCVHSKTKPLYTKDSAESFHRFLFASFIMYAVSINKLRRAFENPALNAIEEQEVIRLAKGFTRFLVNVLSSSSFERHMRVITLDGKYLDYFKTDPALNSTYRMFGQDYDIIDRVAGGAIDVGPATITATPPGDDYGLDVGPATVTATPPADDPRLDIGPTTGGTATTTPLGDGSGLGFGSAASETLQVRGFISPEYYLRADPAT